MDKYIAVFLIAGFSSFSLEASPVEDILAASERPKLLKLQGIQRSHEIKPFTTDGCSGGMTQGWKLLSFVLPEFSHKYGENPPWESCCIEHDKDYWQGDTENGYTKRKLADQTLKTCVAHYGLQHQTRLSQQWNVSEKTIEKSFMLLSEMMYQAVRVGGQPCSVFPWRWGYGWPECSTSSPE